MSTLAQLHFLRPAWLLLLLLIPLLIWALWQMRSQQRRWQRHIAPELLSHLIDGQSGRVAKAPLLGLGLIWLIACVALAGPSWRQLPQPSFQTQSALVYVVDLSPSMNAADISPTRMARLRYKLTDLIKARREGLSALVVYAGDAHVLAPLSDDRQTLLTLVPTLAPDVMPIAGSNVEEAIALSVSLLQNEGFQRGNLLLLSDGVTEQAANEIDQALEGSAYRLSVLGVGTERGAPIPHAEGYIKDASGNIVVAALPRTRLQQLAQRHGGLYSDVRLDGADIEQMQSFLERHEALQQLRAQHAQATQAQFDRWEDAGAWLLLPLLPLVALAFRRGWLLSLCLLLPLGHAPPAQALDWRSLWQTPDQQGAEAMSQSQHQRAAELFESPDWQATARYRQGAYPQAAEAFTELDSARGDYNSGNAWAKAGELQKALEAYDRALKRDPTLADAKANKALVEQLLRQQQQQPSPGQNGQPGDSSPSDPQNAQGQESPSQQGAESEPEPGEPPQNSGDAAEPPSGQQNPSADEQPSSESQQNAAPEGNEQNADSSAHPERGKPSELSEAEQQAMQEHVETEQSAKTQGEASEHEGRSSAPSPTQSEPPEQAQLKKWLGQLPEDPSGLIRNKLQYEYQKKRQAYRKGTWQPNEEQRW